MYEVVNIQPADFQIKTGTTNNRDLQNTELVRKVAPADTTISRSVSSVNPENEDATKVKYLVSCRNIAPRRIQNHCILRMRAAASNFFGLQVE